MVPLPKERHPPFGGLIPQCQAQVRFFALFRIKPHAPPLVRAPVNSFEFQPCDHTPQAGHLTLLLRQRDKVPLLSAHRLRPGLPGYLIPFAPLAFAPQRQVQSRESSSPPAFLLISTHFTAPPGIPLSPTDLQDASFGRPPTGKPWSFTTDLTSRLRAL